MGEVDATAPLSGPEDVDAALQAAQAAFDEGWRDTTPSERMGYLLRMADAIEQNAEKLVGVEAENTGKPKGLTMREEIPPMVDQIRFFAGAARVLEGRASGEYMKGFTSSVRREPVGVIGSVTPWNYPMMMAVWKFAPALAAGNTIVLKPSDATPASTLSMAELFAGLLPLGVFNVVCGDRDTGASLVSHPIPAMVSITGSTRAGRAVAHAAADTVKRCHLELGGKAPVIVVDDADEGSHPRIFVPEHRERREFRSMEDICNYLLSHRQVLDWIHSHGPGGKAVFVMFDVQTEALAAQAGLRQRGPAARERVPHARVPVANWFVLLFLAMVLVLLAFSEDTVIALHAAPVWVAVMVVGYVASRSHHVRLAPDMG
jgi:predicted DNA-binding protein